MQRQGFPGLTTIQSHLGEISVLSSSELLGQYDTVPKEVDNIPQDDIEVHWLPQAHKFMCTTDTNEFEHMHIHPCT